MMTRRLLLSGLLLSGLALRGLVLVALVAGLAGCAAGTVVPVAGAIGASVAIFHRDLFDVLYSGITGRDCSVVRLDEGQSYCRTPDPPLRPQPYCTRSLGVVDCWSTVGLMAPLAPQVADGPATPTPEQTRYRLRRWPDL